MITIKNLNTNQTLTVVPAQMKWTLQDVSAADSGRDYRGVMHKNRVAQKRTLELEFTGLSLKEISPLLKVIDSEYIQVTYPDMYAGSEQTRTFYVGDREAQVYVWWDDKKVLSSTTFNFIEK